MEREQVLRRWVRILTWVFIAGLVISGATAIPLERELDMLARMPGVGDGATATSGLATWILTVRGGLHATYAAYPWTAYGTDWLAFGHFVIAVAFVGALRDPVRNAWPFTFGMIACALVVPYALMIGGLRGIPIYWRLIDCSFGVFGILPVWYCRRWVGEIEAIIEEGLSGKKN
jgi:hypothetical protein